ncbi:MAG TPA: hypothetical protein VLE69_01845 [Candidatus Saccharimonadales bacterium]|nr:hypothetical protein [Candidatus Saccharimonadales bacterium]
MVERTIGIGDTSSFRYIAIEPPLDDTATQNIRNQIILPDWSVWDLIYYKQVTDTDGPAHTEYGFEVGSAEDWLGREVVDEGTVAVAEQIARLLRTNGDTVSIVEGIYPTDFQTPIFGSNWSDMREVAEYFKHRRES